MPLSAQEAPRRWTRFIFALTSPAAVLLALPGLVLLMGAVLTVSAVRELHALGREEALTWFADRARRAEANLTGALSTADTLLARVGDLARERAAGGDLGRFASRLRDLALGRPGLKWLSVSFPDGSFEGVFVDADGSVVFQRSRLVEGRTERARFRVQGDTLERFSETRDTDYDPRARDFYRLAVERRRRIWTDPYPFYSDLRTGITRAEPLFDADGKLLAVVTADYDVTELSGLLRAAGPGGYLVAFTERGEILALHGVRAEAWPKALSRTRALHHSDIRDDTLRAFFAARRSAPGPHHEFRTADNSYLAVEHRVVTARELEWRLAGIVSENDLLAHARRRVQGSAVSIAMVALFAAVLAAAFAAGVSRLRVARREAEKRARDAIDAARDLGSYRLEERIAAGGMGEVWRATHRMLARPAAIKLIRPDLLGDDREAVEARFEREAFTLARMRSPHTVSILDYGKSADGRLFLVMELLEGLSLDRVVKDFGPLPVARVIPILVGVCRSLAEAHAAGLVHRDIKPANIFLCNEGDGLERAKVLDFGLAKQPVGGRLSLDGHASGTSDYMAPEQARGEPLDARADLYSLGCTAFYLLTGRPVFHRESDVGVVIAHQSEPPPALEGSTDQWIPPELDRLTTRCLAKDPNYRPRSAASLARALEAIVVPPEHRVSAEEVRAWWERVAR